ncbi:uncharacterized protein LOC141731989 [Zonotrichia albicollis]|uniref:uncharacterized protein LOC141731989 n=1 Tax=Zonotrichia albicollis TaxID=44394 RepID=UPI003D80F0E5
MFTAPAQTLGGSDSHVTHVVTAAAGHTRTESGAGAPSQTVTTHYYTNRYLRSQREGKKLRRTPPPPGRSPPFPTGPAGRPRGAAGHQLSAGRGGAERAGGRGAGAPARGGRAALARIAARCGGRASPACALGCVPSGPAGVPHRRPEKGERRPGARSRPAAGRAGRKLRRAAEALPGGRRGDPARGAGGRPRSARGRAQVTSFGVGAAAAGRAAAAPPPLPAGLRVPTRAGGRRRGRGPPSPLPAAGRSPGLRGKQRVTVPDSSGVRRHR